MSNPSSVPPQASMGRRQFLTTAASASAALAFARPARLFAQTGKSSDELNIALFGVGAQGRALIDASLKIPNIRFVAICDIWDYNRQYGERYLKKNGHEVRAYRDFGDLLEKEKNIDAVIVATPDVWHAPHTIACLKAGKHVYCEKMMSNTIDGARSM
ncbi:MAG TPA: Gfo/Idh/MocA family oxidoreductase, partial [Opitutaceae bacterium]|nr:Gfo/Idh/MocA family oxidoreductase [Opitutaceae bacterium]